MLMNLTVNGEEYCYKEGNTLLSLLEEMDANVSRVAVMLNGSIVKRDDFATATIKDGDEIEVLIFSGGG